MYEKAIKNERLVEQLCLIFTPNNHDHVSSVVFEMPTIPRKLSTSTDPYHPPD